MKELKYKIGEDNTCLTVCNRNILLGSRFCNSCSYCYDHNHFSQIIKCRKKNVEIKDFKK